MNALFRPSADLFEQLSRLQNHFDAALKDGVLRLAISKAEAAKPRRIEVRAS